MSHMSRFNLFFYPEFEIVFRKIALPNNRQKLPFNETFVKNFDFILA